MLRRLAPLEIELLPAADASTLAGVAQLLKLLTLDADLFRFELRPESDETLLVVRRGPHTLRFHAPALERGLGELLEELSRELLSHGELSARFVDVARGNELVAHLGAGLEQLSRATSVESVTQTVLTAALAGASGFERAAVFLYDRAQQAWLAAGGRERGEIPEPPASIASSGPPSRRMAPPRPTSPFQEAAKSLSLAATGDDDDPITIATRGQRLVFDRPFEGPDPLAALDPRSRFALVAATHKSPAPALLFGDGEASSLSVERLGQLRELLAQACLAWEALRLRREVEDLTRTDQDTGLYNRRELELRFSQERARARRAEAPLSLLLLGASVDAEPAMLTAELRGLGGVLRHELRAVDIAARFDQAELAVLLPGAGSLEAALVARRVGVTAHRRSLAPCVGVASYPDDCDHPDDLVALAKSNLDAARVAGPGHASLSGGDAPIVFAEEAGDAPSESGGAERESGTETEP